MQIAFCGAGGTGKGTLLKYLQCRLGNKNYEILPSPVSLMGRKIAPESKDYADMSKARKVLMQYSALLSEINAEFVAIQNYQNFIAERSLIDFLPYMQDFLSTCKEKTWPYDYAFYEHIVKDQLINMPYDILFYVPIEFLPSKEDLKENSWKERDEKKRKATDKEIQKHLAWIREHVPHTEIVKVTGSLKKRMDIVDKAIDDAIWGRVSKKEKFSYTCPECGRKTLFLYSPCTAEFKLTKHGAIGGLIVDEAGLQQIRNTASVDGEEVDFGCKCCGSRFRAIPHNHNDEYIVWEVGEEW